MRLAHRTNQITPSVTIGLSQKAQALKQQGVDLVAFTAGEPDFDTPAPIVEAAVEALRGGDTKYVPKGISALKKAICDRTFEERGVRYEPSQVLVSCGAKHSLANACLALLEEGDEALIVAPYWLSYPEMVTLAGATPVYVETTAASGFVPDPDAVREKVTDRTRLLIVNSPSNPTGATFPRHVVHELGRIAIERGLWVLADEIYDKLVFSGSEFASVLEVGGDIVGRTILINGASKTYAMTGWRIGWALGPPAAISAMSAIQSHTTSDPTSFSQTATVTALAMDQAVVEHMRADFERRRDIMLEELRALRRAEVAVPGGAFYVFPNVAAYIQQLGLGGSVELSEWLLEKARVVVVPGKAFGDDGCIRLSFAVSEANIREGVRRIAHALEGEH